MSLTYLALGDSYTIGEQVPVYDSFPYQAVQLLRKNGLPFTAPEIIAKTGWTSDELIEAVRHHCFLPHYNIVSLLIGVNNQYRGLSVESFEPEFDFLLQTAIRHSGNEPGHVFVISIPDWGITPYASGRDEQKIAMEIDQFNHVCKKRALHFHANFLEITTAQRSDGRKPEFIATDGLHPSGKEYAKWASVLATEVREKVMP
jgi:hypothetical protein